MEENYLIEDIEFNNEKTNEEDPILVAQRYLNIFHQIHIFNSEKKEEFNQSLIEMPAKIKRLLITLPGGRILLEHIQELEEKKGLSSKETLALILQNKNSDKNEIKSTSVSNAENSGVISGGELKLGETFANDLANSLASAFKNNNLLPSANMNSIPANGSLNEISDMLNKSIKTYTNNMQNLTETILEKSIQHISNIHQTSQTSSVQHSISTPLQTQASNIPAAQQNTQHNTQNSNSTTINNISMDSAFLNSIQQTILKNDEKRHSDFVELIEALNKNLTLHSNRPADAVYKGEPIVVPTPNIESSTNVLATSIREALQASNKQQIEAIKAFSEVLVEAITQSQKELARTLLQSSPRNTVRVVVSDDVEYENNKQKHQDFVSHKPETKFETPYENKTNEKSSFIKSFSEKISEKTSSLTQSMASPSVTTPVFENSIPEKESVSKNESESFFNKINKGLNKLGDLKDELTKHKESKVENKKTQPQTQVKDENKKTQPQAQVKDENKKPQPHTQVKDENKKTQPQAQIKNENKKTQPQTQVKDENKKTQPQAQVKDENKKTQPQAQIKDENKKTQPQAQIKDENKKTQPQAQIKDENKNASNNRKEAFSHQNNFTENSDSNKNNKSSLSKNLDNKESLSKELDTENLENILSDIHLNDSTSSDTSKLNIFDNLEGINVNNKEDNSNSVFDILGFGNDEKDSENPFGTPTTSDKNTQSEKDIQLTTDIFETNDSPNLDSENPFGTPVSSLDNIAPVKTDLTAENPFGTPTTSDENTQSEEDIQLTTDIFETNDSPNLDSENPFGTPTTSDKNTQSEEDIQLTTDIFETNDSPVATLASTTKEATSIQQVFKETTSSTKNSSQKTSGNSTYDDALEKIKNALNADNNVSLNEINVNPVNLNSDTIPTSSTEQTELTSDDIVLNDDNFDSFFNNNINNNSSPSNNDEWEYVDENGNEITSSDDEWEYVDENGNPIDSSDDEWEYVDENGNPIDSSDEEWEYVDENGNPINSFDGEWEYVDENGNPINKKSI